VGAGRRGAPQDIGDGAQAVLQLNARPPPDSFRARLLAGELLLGTFVKTPTIHTTEILGELGYDFVVIDQEHAPFDRTAIDAVLLAARAARIPALVRVPAADPAPILAALDDGAHGVVVPHVSDVEIARRVASSSRYRGGARGFSNSPRAGRYGTASVWEHVDTCDALTTVIAMIEDPSALDKVDDIVACHGIDAFLIGRGDLTVSLGAAAPDAPEVRAALERIAAAARARSKPLCAYCGRLNEQEFSWLRSVGVTAFIVSSDQGLLRAAGTDALERFKELACRSTSAS
jgi:staphyloferrin B biosynthesis citrate synthase